MAKRDPASPKRAAATAPAADETGCTPWLYDANGQDRPIALAQAAALDLRDDHVLWVDLLAPTPACLDHVWQVLELPGAMLEKARLVCSQPSMFKHADWFQVCAVAVQVAPGLDFQGDSVLIVAGRNIVLTLHPGRIDYLEKLRSRERSDSSVGLLSAESFVASLLDWHLSSYFEAASSFELAVERLEVDILGGRHRDSLPELRRLRRAASRLRRMLAPHRAVFGAMSRPDFRPQEGERANQHFVALDTRFERAMDIVENSRDLVMGSFELFSGQTVLMTNDSMRLLTFVTVVLGVLGVLSGMLGMSFNADLFRTADVGFWASVAGMGALGAAAWGLAVLKRWI